ncbi:MAG: Nif3-like dinuclear metal center hexameric protein [Verrucomicrobiae bacterium]|nr:Nif3-like dinuclear metal center hexameric protein [Verrucomicrobiae bacterium]
MATNLKQFVQFSDDFLNIREIQDWPGAKNGLQVEGPQEIRRLATAVDANLLTIQGAIECEADLLLVHHGLFWGEITPLTGAHYRKIKLCLDHGLAVYSAHLPLDLHPKVGNNVLLAQALGFRKWRPFFFGKGQYIGVQTQTDMTLRHLLGCVEAATGYVPRLLAGGGNRVRKVGIVTGGAGNEVALAAAEGVDTFITGEGSHHSFGLAHDFGINVIHGGHYATETFGVRAFGKMLGKKFGLGVVNLEVPSGL